MILVEYGKQDGAGDENPGKGSCRQRNHDGGASHIFGPSHKRVNFRAKPIDSSLNCRIKNFRQEDEKDALNENKLFENRDGKEKCNRDENDGAKAFFAESGFILESGFEALPGVSGGIQEAAKAALPLQICSAFYGGGHKNEEQKRGKSWLAALE